MNRDYGDCHYTTTPVSNNSEGWTGLELHCTRADGRDCVARLLFWDASGQFSLETLGTDIPVVIAEDLIAEGRATIKTG